MIVEHYPDYRQLTNKYKEALSSTKVELAAGQGAITDIDIDNPNASPIFLQFFDAAAADVTVGTTVPTWSIMIPTSSKQAIEYLRPLVFSTAIVIAVTTGRKNDTAPGTAATAHFRGRVPGGWTA